MKWTDIENISEELEQKYPEVEILALRYTLLKKMILNLPDFKDSEEGCNEKVLEAVQAAWLEIREDN